MKRDRDSRKEEKKLFFCCWGEEKKMYIKWTVAKSGSTLGIKKFIFNILSSQPFSEFVDRFSRDFKFFSHFLLFWRVEKKIIQVRSCRISCFYCRLSWVRDEERERDIPLRAYAWDDGRLEITIEIHLTDRQKCYSKKTNHRIGRNRET